MRTAPGQQARVHGHFCRACMPLGRARPVLGPGGVRGGVVEGVQRGQGGCGNGHGSTRSPEHD